MLYHICYKACSRANFCETLLSMENEKTVTIFFKQSATPKWGVRGVAGVWDVCGVWVESEVWGVCGE